MAEPFNFGVATWNNIASLISYYEEMLYNYLTYQVETGQLGNTQAQILLDDFSEKFSGDTPEKRRALLKDIFNSGKITSSEAINVIRNKTGYDLFDQIEIFASQYPQMQIDFSKEQQQIAQDAAREAKYGIRGTETFKMQGEAAQANVRSAEGWRLADSIINQPRMASRLEAAGMSPSYWYERIGQGGARFNEAGDSFSPVYNDMMKELEANESKQRSNIGTQYKQWLPNAYSQYAGQYTGEREWGSETTSPEGITQRFTQQTPEMVRASGYTGAGISDANLQYWETPEESPTTEGFYKYIQQNKDLQKQATESQAAFLRKYPTIGSKFLEAQATGSPSTGSFMEYVGSQPDLLAQYQEREKDLAQYQSWGTATKSPKARFLFNR